MTGVMLNEKHWKDERRVIEWDAISYYAYLPAAFIYNDLSLSFADNYRGPHKFIVWPDKGPEGRYVIKTSMGLSMLWSPFFLTGHAAAILTGADAGGYSPPYKFFLLVSALSFLATGLVYLRKYFFCIHLMPLPQQSSRHSSLAPTFTGTPSTRERCHMYILSHSLVHLFGIQLNGIPEEIKAHGPRQGWDFC